MSRMQRKGRASVKWIIGVALLGVLGAGAVLSSKPKTEFDGGRAFDILKRQCDLGPRPVGTPAHEKMRAFLLQAMKQVADSTVVQDFNWAKGGKSYRLTNILGVLNPKGQGSVMISGHWDTRPTADQEKDPEKRKLPIMGAHDGASEVAVILELGRVLRLQRPKAKVYLMLFDGEDFGPKVDNMFLGARYFARHMGENRPDKMILIDMIGDADLNIYKETNSLNSDRDLVERVWSTAARLGYSKQFPNELKYTIQDDHLSMQDAGVPSIDLIDFDYPYWHTLGDTVDKCSPGSLEAVGRTLQTVVKEW